MTKSSVLSFAFGAAAFIVLTCAAGLRAHAQDAAGSPAAAEVAYSDLDLAHPEGQQALADRIHAAARSVCGGEPSQLDLSRRYMFRHCVQGAEDRAFIEMQLLIAESTRSSSQPVLVAKAEPLR